MNNIIRDYFHSLDIGVQLESLYKIVVYLITVLFCLLFTQPRLGVYSFLFCLERTHISSARNKHMVQLHGIRRTLLWFKLITHCFQLLHLFYVIKICIAICYLLFVFIGVVLLFLDNSVYELWLLLWPKVSAYLFRKNLSNNT